MPVNISPAGPADLDELAPLFDRYRRFYGKASDPAAGRAFLAARMAAGESVVFIARIDGRAVGFTQLYPLFSSTRLARLWLLNDLYVDESARGQGAGAALLERARAHADATGGCELMLETAVDNPARRLYERCGYAAVTDYVFYSLPLSSGGHA